MHQAAIEIASDFAIANCKKSQGFPTVRATFRAFQPQEAFAIAGVCQNRSTRTARFRCAQIREKLKGSLLKSSFDKRLRIDLLIPLPCSPFPFSLIFRRNPNLSPRDTNRSSHPSTKTTPRIKYPFDQRKKARP